MFLKPDAETILKFISHVTRICPDVFHVINEEFFFIDQSISNERLYINFCGFSDQYFITRNEDGKEESPYFYIDNVHGKQPQYFLILEMDDVISDELCIKLFDLHIHVQYKTFEYITTDEFSNFKITHHIDYDQTQIRRRYTLKDIINEENK